MISVYVVEDEPGNMETILGMLSKLDVEVKGSSKDIESAFAGIRETSPQLVLLDVEVGDRTSFDLLDKFDKVDFKVIFVTAHQKYAVNAFRFSAVDFLLKPLSFKLLQEALEKVSLSFMKSQTTSLNTLRDNLNNDRGNEKIMLKTQDKIHVLRLDQILHCQSDMSYTIFYTASEKIVISKTIGYYEELLEDFGFFRVHKSHLINLDQVVQIHKTDGGEVELSDGTRVPISQRKKDEFIKRVNKQGLQ